MYYNKIFKSLKWVVNLIGFFLELNKQEQCWIWSL